MKSTNLKKLQIEALITRINKMTVQKNEYKMELIKAKKTNLRMKHQTEALMQDNESMQQVLAKNGLEAAAYSK